MPKIWVAFTAALWQYNESFKSLVHHTPRSFSSLTTSKTVDKLVMQSF